VLKVWNYLTDAKETTEQPTRFAMEQNYPNPFNPSTVVRFEVGSSKWVTLKVHDVLGREVAILVNGVLTPGRYSTTFDGSGLASGVYYYRLAAGSFMVTRKAVLIR
jgi:hypothetical protein